MSELIIISEEARNAADFLQPMDSRFGRDYVEQSIQLAINAASAEKDKRIAELEGHLRLRTTIIEGYGDHVLKQDRSIAEARRLLEHFTDDSDISWIIRDGILKWLDGKP